MQSLGYIPAQRHSNVSAQVKAMFHAPDVFARKGKRPKSQAIQTAMSAPLRLKTMHFSAAPALALALLLAACTAPPKGAAPAPLVSTVPPLEQFMSDAARSKQEGARAVERETYRKAAQAYPTSKEPWLRLAEGYFETGDFGNAILSAQEALQRDSADKVASSLVAVSGLRVSANALSTLRQSKEFGGDTKRQAEELVKTIREALGETVLVPKPDAAGSGTATTASPAPRRADIKPVARPPGQPAVAGSTPAATGTKKPGNTPANPFDVLK